ncbi:class I SAM-dependent methyltransferase [Pseudonocardia sp. T1-2H]|uniref:class I SAM-dependent methyltransferase n=1 Tax=Pseudonocardia sp. T1-2H TaxID=3128899 RepID=UPI0031010246
MGRRSASPSRPGRFRYGVEAPYALGGLAAAGLVFLAAAGWWRSPALAVAAVVLFVQAGFFLHSTVRGKHRVWEREVDRLNLDGPERLLDLGCGRGAVLIIAARRLPWGLAVGVDLWRTRDQSGNASGVTLANAAAAGVADRVGLCTVDMTALPFADGTFDVVTSALAVHNIPTADGRARALDEAVRVLRPGGRLLLADFRHTEEYRRHLGPAADVRSLGPCYWYGGPWAATRMVTLAKP